MKIDDMRAVPDDLIEKPEGNSRCNRAPLTAGKTPVQITPVRQVAGLMNKAEQINHRHQHQCAMQPPQRAKAAQAPDDFNTIEFVAVDRRTDQQDRSGATAMNDLYGHVEWRVGIKIRHRQIKLQPLTGLYRITGQDKRFGPGR